MKDVYGKIVIKAICGEQYSMIMGIGIDIVYISKIRAIIERWGERFLNRIFTKEEIGYCLGKTNSALHFAGTFAAKEATYKALALSINVLHWKEIEVIRKLDGIPEIALHGKTNVRSQQIDLRKIFLSISHSGDIAIAQCIAVGSE